MVDPGGLSYDNLRLPRLSDAPSVIAYSPVMIGNQPELTDPNERNRVAGIACRTTIKRESTGTITTYRLQMECSPVDGPPSWPADARIGCGPMTLNITVAARWLMAQSSDFRLTGGEVSDTAQKQVVLHYLDWSGLVATSAWLGTGRPEGLARYRRLAGKSATHDERQQTPDQIVKRSTEEGSVGSPPRPATQPHSGWRADPRLVCVG